MKSNHPTKKEWVELCQAIGLSESDMQQWHHEFESRYPQAHQEFLEWINIPDGESPLLHQ